MAMARVRHGDWLFSSDAEDLRDVCSSSAVVTVSAVAAGPHDHSLPQHKSILSGQFFINFLCVAAARFYWTSTRSRPNPVTKQRKMSQHTTAHHSTSHHISPQHNTIQHNSDKTTFRDLLLPVLPPIISLLPGVPTTRPLRWSPSRNRTVALSAVIFLSVTSTVSGGCWGGFGSKIPGEGAR